MSDSENAMRFSLGGDPNRDVTISGPQWMWAMLRNAAETNLDHYLAIGDIQSALRTGILADSLDHRFQDAVNNFTDAARQRFSEDVGAEMVITISIGPLVALYSGLAVIVAAHPELKDPNGDGQLVYQALNDFGMELPPDFITFLESQLEMKVLTNA